VYRVDILEYQRGWSPRIDETFYYDNEAEAKAFVEEFNAAKPALVADRYLKAVYVGEC
jgi:hypothetical protein